MKNIAMLLAPLAMLVSAGLAAPAAAAAAAQSGAATANSAEPEASDNGLRSVRDSAGRIVTQPARDVGAAKTRFPQPLVDARADPYSLKGIRTCSQIVAAFRSLSEVLGPDFAAGSTKKENRAGKIAEAGGQTVINGLIPFRGLVREISGAAPAKRRLNQMIDAGYARRGFLRGVYTARKCKRPALS